MTSSIRGSSSLWFTVLIRSRSGLGTLKLKLLGHCRKIEKRAKACLPLVGHVTGDTWLMRGAYSDDCALRGRFSRWCSVQVTSEKGTGHRSTLYQFGGVVEENVNLNLDEIYIYNKNHQRNCWSGEAIFFGGLVGKFKILVRSLSDPLCSEFDSRFDEFGFLLCYAYASVTSRWSVHFDDVIGWGSSSLWFTVLSGPVRVWGHWSWSYWDIVER